VGGWGGRVGTHREEEEEEEEGRGNGREEPAKTRKTQGARRVLLGSGGARGCRSQRGEEEEDRGRWGHGRGGRDVSTMKRRGGGEVLRVRFFGPGAGAVAI